MHQKMCAGPTAVRESKVVANLPPPEGLALPPGNPCMGWSSYDFQSGQHTLKLSSTYFRDFRLVEVER